jgi:hypothetical protein
MAKMSEVLQILCPNVEWYVRGEEFDDIDWLGAKAPITKAQYQAGFAQVDAIKAQQDADKATAKAALLAQLGITAEQAKLLLS